MADGQGSPSSPSRAPPSKVGDYVRVDEETQRRWLRNVYTPSQLAAESRGAAQAPADQRQSGPWYQGQGGQGGQAPAVPLQVGAGCFCKKCVSGAVDEEDGASNVVPLGLPELPVVTWNPTCTSPSRAPRLQPVVERRPLVRVKTTGSPVPGSAADASDGGVPVGPGHQDDGVPKLVMGRYLYLESKTSPGQSVLHLCFPVDGAPTPLPGKFAWGLRWDGIDPGSDEALRQDRAVLEAALELALQREEAAGDDFPYLERMALDTALEAANRTTGNAEVVYQRPQRHHSGV